MKSILFFLSFSPIYLNASDLSGFNGPVWIDVRTSSEYYKGHVEGAILIPFDEIEKGVTDLALPLDTKIYLYCKSGRRAQKALNTLQSIGYSTLINLGSLENAVKTK